MNDDEEYVPPTSTMYLPCACPWKAESPTVLAFDVEYGMDMSVADLIPKEDAG